MLWPLLQPMQITLGIMVAVILIATPLAIVFKWKPGLVFFGSVALAIVGFIPTCAGVMSILDTQRFGIFQYATYSQVQDFRIERYLPTAARLITLEKTGMGHRAKYTISELELRAYLDDLWERHGENSAISRADLHDGEPARSEEIELEFQGLSWPALSNAIRFHSPVEGDGGGATYYFEAATGTVYHRAGYW